MNNTPPFHPISGRGERVLLITHCSLFIAHYSLFKRELENVNEHLLDDGDAVCVVRLPGDGAPEQGEFEEAGYRILKSIAPAVKDRVLIKPNVLPETEFGLMTHPAFVGGMVDYLTEVGVREVMVGEGGWGKNDPMEAIWGRTGYAVMAENRDVKLVDLNVEGVEVEVPNPEFTDALNLSRLVMDEDLFLIDAPKMKTHHLGVTTLCMKNLMGTVICPDRNFCTRSRKRSEELTGSPEAQCEVQFARILNDLSSVVKPDLCVVEGVVGRDGTGVHRGNNMPCRIAISGTNSAVVDAFTSYVMGFDPKAIPYLQEAARRGLGTNEMDRIKVYEAVDGAMMPRKAEEVFLGTFELISWTKTHRPELYVKAPSAWKYEEGDGRK